MKKIVFFIFCFFVGACFVWSQSGKGQAKFRKEISLNSSWETIVLNQLTEKEETFVQNPKVNAQWQKVNVPHNWDQYYGFLRTKHGNLHGTAWYHKTLQLDKKDSSKRLFLFLKA
ncbi:hypothetical protein [Flavobacterium gyeonganense]|uniref:hypothetical protein n=1 Tax=Flavobacterium gyeonganense TaxID=1310418 RepID=UPI002413D8B1|nr:hypothetical protein [Flavobacterium gyeonganense]